MRRRTVRALKAAAAGLLTVVLVAPAWAVQAAGQARPGQQEFVPIDELPPAEQLPAAPLLILAYAFVWVALMAYLWAIWRRLDRVERELADVARRTESDARRS